MPHQPHPWGRPRLSREFSECFQTEPVPSPPPASPPRARLRAPRSRPTVGGVLGSCGGEKVVSRMGSIVSAREERTAFQALRVFQMNGGPGGSEAQSHILQTENVVSASRERDRRGRKLVKPAARRKCRLPCTAA